MRELASTIAEVELRPPTRTLEDRLELAAGCKLITLGGGHTESDAFLVLTDRRVAVVGDLLCVAMHPWMGHGDPDRWIEILGELERLVSIDSCRGTGGSRRPTTCVPYANTYRGSSPTGEHRVLYPDWDFWGDTADRNRDFLRERET